jgi:riboflavin synthase
MFTGIIHHTATLSALVHTEHELRITIKTAFADLLLGESIAVDGVCLTVAEINGQHAVFVLSAETIACTTASTYAVGQRVHLERALQATDRLGGHWVTGHVDGMLTVQALTTIGECLRLDLAGPLESVYLVPKGAITLHGVSLTVNSVDSNSFSVMLIPHTLSCTALANLQPGQRVNVEWDYLAKLVHNHMRIYTNGNQ